MTDMVISQEGCTVHLDKSFYVTGELVWYKLYLPTAMKDKNAAIKTSLVSSTGNTMSNHFNQTEGETHVSGYYKLPFGLSSGVYSIVFSAAKSKAEAEEVFAEIYVPIYNDLEALPSDQLGNATEIQSYNTNAATGGLAVSITLDKEVYNSRDKVNAQIEVRDASGNPVATNISVAIKDAAITSTSQYSNTVYQGNNIDINNNETFLEKIYVKGSYTKDDGELIPNEIMGAYATDENKLHFAVPDPATGKFHVEFPNYYNSKSIQFFPFVSDGKDLNIKLDNVGKGNTKKLSYNDAIIDYIKLSRQRKKLFQRYTSLESNINPQEYSTEVLPFKSNKAYDITEYKSFVNVASFLKEVSTPLRMKEKKGDFEGAMYMPSKLKSYSEYAEEPPIYILNGYLTRNSDYVGKLDLDLITSLAMMYDPKTIREEYKIFGATGLVDIKLKSKDIMVPDSDKEDVYILNGLLPATAFPVFNPSDIDNDQYQPFFRPQLYWNGDLTTDSSGKVSFDYFQSDDVSTFIIEVVAQAADSSVTTVQKTYQSVWQ